MSSKTQDPEVRSRLYAGSVLGGVLLVMCAVDHWSWVAPAAVMYAIVFGAYQKMRQRN